MPIFPHAQERENRWHGVCVSIGTVTAVVAVATVVSVQSSTLHAWRCRMLGSFVCQFDVESGLWQIVSPSEHVVYESPSRDLVEAVYEALCFELQETASREIDQPTLCELVW
jgi:hypothetical protein